MSFFFESFFGRLFFAFVSVIENLPSSFFGLFCNAFFRRSGVFESNVFFLIIIFVVFADIDCQEFLIEDMYSPHDVLDLLQGCAVGDVEQMAVEFIPSLYDSLSCG